MNRKTPRALIVEDERTLASVLSMLFSIWGGFQADCVLTVADALAHLAEPERYDLVVLDLMLPDGDGIEVLRHIRTKKLTLPVFVSSAKDMVGMQDVYDLKPEWVYTKPISIYKMEQVVKGIAGAFRPDNSKVT